MNFDQTPHPLVEDHSYIRELINRQERRTADKKYHQEVEKKRDAVLKDIKGFKDIELLDFYCEQCNKDFIGRARKQIDSWQTIAYYKVKHKCGTWCIRHITDRIRDPYFYNSRKVARDRGENFKDLLQTFETGFNLVHGKK